MGFFDNFRQRGSVPPPSPQSEIQRDDVIQESTIHLDEGHTLSMELGMITGITESVNTRSPNSISKLIASDEIPTSLILDELKSDYSDEETFKENEEMGRDSVVGSAMELMADDVCQVDEKYKTIVHVSSSDDTLTKFLSEFLENNVNVEDRVWEWSLELIKHGDFKLRRREFLGPDKKTKDVYYENVIQSYKVSRIEYMGRVIGFVDEEDDKTPAFCKPETFIHFMNSKLPKRKIVKVQIKGNDDKPEEIRCVKVRGSSIMDNSRYIFRIINLLDNMLILSRVARSTQYNLVKVEVGNAGPAKTQEMLSSVRRSIEGYTKAGKKKGIKTDPSPIPVNSNIYIPTRSGQGDVTVDSVNESVDVRSIVDIDYFRNKEFATLKVPKSYLGFEEELPGSMGNTSLVKLDIRYARPVQRVQTIIRYGIEALCNNYLEFRGKKDWIGKFDIEMRTVVSSETDARVGELASNLQLFDSCATMLQTYPTYIDKARLFNTLLSIVGLNPEDVGSKVFLDIVQKMEDNEYEQSEDDIKAAQEAEEGDEGSGW